MSYVEIGSESSGTRSSDLYRAVWRWHFYAGLLVLPFMVTLAVTGALYLFRDEIDNLIHADLMQVEVREGVAPASPEAMVAAALREYPGKALSFTDPLTTRSAAQVKIGAQNGETLSVFVDPYDAKVLGSMPYRGSVMWTIRYLHSLKYFGTYARYLIEIAAGWAILLVGTGIYLWWPRTQTGGVMTVRGTPSRRVFWRDTHAVSGTFVGSFIVFLALTGMPWSGVWGAKVNEWANGSNFGYPSGVFVDVPVSEQRLNDLTKTSWSLEQAQVPESPVRSEGSSKIGLDEAVSVFERLNLHPGYVVDIPSTPEGVYTGSVFPDELAMQRVTHIDQYSGEVLIDTSFKDYGPVGRWLEWGINVHMGQEFGLVNQLVLTVVCLAIVLLAVSAGTMWWKRRPKGSLGVPPLPSDRRVFRGLLVLLVFGGIVFPLVGLSLIVMLLLDQLLMRYKRNVRRLSEAAEL